MASQRDVLCILRRLKRDDATGWRERASGPRLPGQCMMENLQARQDSLILRMSGFLMLLRSRSLNIPSSGL